jgi:hypothetical protein
MWLQRYGTDPLVGEVYIAYIESRMLAGESPLEDLRAFLKTPQADRLDEMTRLHAALLETHMTQHGWDEVLTRIRLTPEPLPEAVQQALWRGRPDKIPESLRQPIDVPALEDLHGLWQKHPSDASTFVWPSYESFLTSMGMAEGGPP